MKSTFAKMTTLLSVILAGAFSTATAIAQLTNSGTGGTDPNSAKHTACRWSASNTTSVA